MRRPPFTAALALLAFAPSLSRAADPKVERVWKGKCASCHGMDGRGQTEQGKKQGALDMTTAAWQSKFTGAGGAASA